MTLDIALTEEDKGFLGERYDEHAELQFLNNRYYDPELALFIQPDWLGVTEQGVGTNRYAYANNDPINKFDPEGNSWLTSLFGFIVGALTGQPWIVAALTTGFDTAIALGNGATLGEALTSAAIQMAIATMVHGLPDVGEAGLFGGGGATTSVAKGEYISISTRGRGGFWKWGKGGIGRQSKVTGLYGDEIDSAGITFLKSGKLPEHIKTPTYVSRGQALKAARIDAGITRADKFDVVREVYTNKWGKVVLDDLGAPIMTRNYVYTQRGIIIQEHPAHFFGRGVNGNIGAHFNVRPLDNLRHGIVRGTKPHYDWGLVAK
ncbi:MAG: hypothetical protein K8F25_10480 [Fimbriimonadaceae bacterium]|nr:hypothetical protein [Alphaproteobacteria bacterium]